MQHWTKDVVACGGALVVAVTLVPLDVPAIVLVLPIILAAFWGGLRTGLLTTALLTVIAGYSFVAGAYGDARIETHDLMRVIGLLVAGVTVSLLCEMLDRARRRAEHSERMYSESFHASPIPLVLTDLSTGQTVDCNQAYCTLTGWSRDEMRGKTANERNIAKHSDRIDLQKRLMKERSVRDVPVHVQRKDGETRETLMSAVLVDMERTPHALTTIIDVTDGKRAEERFRELAETIDEVFWVTSPDKRQILYVSPAYERVWGRTCESLYADPAQWLDAVHPEDRERVRADAMPGPQQGAPHFELRIVRPDGKVRWIHNKSFRIYDASGAIVRLAGVATDITEHRRLEAELHQAQKLESLGRLAGGIAHDFNNVLAVIAMNAGFLLEELATGHESRDMAVEIEHAVRRATGLTRQLLAFSRKQVVDPIVLDPNKVIAETHKMLHRMIGEDIQIELSLEPELANVRIDSGQLVQVLLNLAVNARDAMPRGGKLAVATRNFVNGKRSVLLTVRDTGFGMSPEVRERAFEPFFTTKEAGKGTGMGLAVVHGIVEQAGGHIELESAPGAGTTFSIYLPAIDDAEHSVGEVSPAIANGSETVLVVDDDPHVRHAASRALTQRGYRTIEAADGRVALHLLANERIDLLVTDVVMPGMDGRELVEAAHAERPALKVLYTTGYTDDEVLRHGVSQGEVDLLEKPFRSEVLAAKVRAVLDA